jgi:hypothetical protein
MAHKLAIDSLTAYRVSTQGAAPKQIAPPRAHTVVKLQWRCPAPKCSDTKKTMER